ncbi:MAG: hypothetical protein E7231_18425 [Cellulosilyticum sp.]|nr:hypothetical protein [Cellulosilyticum sp.]
MKKQEEAKIKDLLFEATAYDEYIKKQVWENIENELFKGEKSEVGDMKKKSRVRKWKFTIIAVAVLVGGTLCAEPVVSALQKYFGQTKSQDFYNPKEEVFVKAETELYKSELGYTTFYNKDYFEMTQMENKEQFIARTGKQDGMVEIELIKDKSYETLVEEFGDGKIYGGGNVEGVQEIYSQTDEETNIYKGISLCNAGEMGVFKITIEYDENNFTARTFCYSIENQFVYLNPVRTQTIENGKGVIKFEYDKHQYELVRDTSMPDIIRLQKIGSNLSKRGDIVLSYQHRIDSAKMCMEAAQADHQNNVNRMKEWVNSIEDASERAEEEKLLLERIPLFEEIPNDLKVSAIKIQTGTKRYVEWNYYIEDGKGGCYDLFIMDINADGLSALLESIEMVEGEEEIMEVIDRAYQAVG